MTDVLSTNQAHFSKIAAQYDRHNAPTIVRLEREVQDRAPFLGVKPGSRFLDYACGTGMLSRALSKNVVESIGIDVTEKMVDMYNAQAQAEPSSSAPRSAYHGNLADPSDPSPDAFSDAKFFNFDLVGVGLGWHHFEDCDLAAKRLAERLSPGGVFFVVDFASHEMDNDKSESHGVTHHGFSRAQIRAMFEGAGVGGDFAFEEFADPVEFKTLHGDGHGDGHGHGHGHGHDHDHGHGHGEGHGHSHGHGDEKPTLKRRVFIARGTKV